MQSRRTVFQPVELSLEDILGSDRARGAAEGRASLTGEDASDLRKVASRRVDFYPVSLQQRLVELLPRVGLPLSAAVTRTPRGATTTRFQAHTRTDLAPVSGLGYFRLTEDGRLFLTAKSEHYHASLGHAFPGFGLIEHARRLGIPNATHNNTRGYITRVLEEDLVRAAAGVARGDDSTLQRLLTSNAPPDLNRIINLETGSIAAEAALKMLLSRFYTSQTGCPAPVYGGRTPVLLVIGDEEGGLLGNYHGTTLLTQALRGMWPELTGGLEAHELLLVRGVPPNDLRTLEGVFEEYDRGPRKIAGFLLELVLMNYGAKCLGEPFVRRIGALCRSHDVPVVVDEIQTCIWSPELFLFREYGLRPDFVVVGKGFPGGEFAASRVIFSSAMDTLPQFGALVTSGQEELASLAYLITIRWAEANADVTRAVGDYYEERLQELVSRHPGVLSHVDGKRHLAGIFFHDLKQARQFVEALATGGVDISIQLCGEGSPPSAITKLPLIAGFEVVDFLIARMENALAQS